MSAKTYLNRRGKSNHRYLRTDAETGTAVRLIADDEGLIRITSDAEQRVADAKGLPTVKAVAKSKESSDAQ